MFDMCFQLIGAYLNEDVFDEYGDLGTATLVFLEESNEADRVQLLKEVETLRSIADSDKTRLSEILQALGWTFEATPSELSVFFSGIADLTEAHIG